MVKNNLDKIVKSSSSKKSSLSEFIEVMRTVRFKEAYTTPRNYLATIPNTLFALPYAAAEPPEYLAASVLFGLGMLLVPCAHEVIEFNKELDGDLFKDYVESERNLAKVSKEYNDSINN